MMVFRRASRRLQGLQWRRRQLGFRGLARASAPACGLASSDVDSFVDEANVRFQLFRVLDVESALPGQETSPDMLGEALAMSRRLAAEHFAPHNRRNDLEEPQWVSGGDVAIHEEVPSALAAFRDAGLCTYTRLRFVSVGGHLS